ncbi:hypothetical protein NW759_016502 [Fusarium solani]|nr:hypothetical protein NW759_016502 [Fusarium solani]
MEELRMLLQETQQRVEKEQRIPPIADSRRASGRRIGAVTPDYIALVPRHCFISELHTTVRHHHLDRPLQGQSPSLQIEPRVEPAMLLDMVSVIGAPFLSLDYEQLQAVSEVQTILRPPTTLSVQAGLNDTETGSAY